MAHRILEEFREHGVLRGRSLYLPTPYAIKAIERAKTERARLLGFNGLFITEDYTQPSMEDSTDYSYDFGENVYDDAIKFIKEREQKGLYFDIVLAK